MIFSGRSRTRPYDLKGMIDYRKTSPAPAETPEEDDWFGEGNAFESGEELAAALLALATQPDVDEPAAVAAEPAMLTAPDSGDSFVLVDGRDLAPVIPRPQTAAPAPAPKRTWSVRSPGAVALPPRAPGKSGWSIRNSVMVLQHTEEILNKLRQEAVAVSLLAAARAFHPEHHLPKQQPQAR